MVFIHPLALLTVRKNLEGRAGGFTWATLQYMYLVNNRSVQVRTGIWQNLDVSDIVSKRGQIQSMGRVIVLCFWAGYFALSAPPSTQ